MNKNGGHKYYIMTTRNTTNEDHRTKTYGRDHTTYGGEVSLYDFEGSSYMSDIAKKIARDLSFDETCRKNAENCKRYNCYMDY